MAGLGTVTWQKEPGGSSGSSILASLDRVRFIFTNVTFSVGVDYAAGIYLVGSQTATAGTLLAYASKGQLGIYGQNGTVITNQSYSNGVITASFYWVRPQTLSPGANNFYFYLENTVLGGFGAGSGTDRRTVAINAIPYSAPTITNAQAVRCDSSGIETNLGTYVKVKASWTYSSLDGSNAANASFRWGMVGGQLSAAISLTNNVFSLPQGGSVLPQENYQAVITVTDTIGGSATRTLQIRSMSVVFEALVDGSGVAFGKEAAISDRADFTAMAPLSMRYWLQNSAGDKQGNIRGMFNQNTNGFVIAFFYGDTMLATIENTGLHLRPGAGIFYDLP